MVKIDHLQLIFEWGQISLLACTYDLIESIVLEAGKKNPNFRLFETKMTDAFVISNLKKKKPNKQINKKKYFTDYERHRLREKEKKQWHTFILNSTLFKLFHHIFDLKYIH